MYDVAATVVAVVSINAVGLGSDQSDASVVFGFCAVVGGVEQVGAGYVGDDVGAVPDVFGFEAAACLFAVAEAVGAVGVGGGDAVGEG